MGGFPLTYMSAPPKAKPAPANEVVDFYTETIDVIADAVHKNAVAHGFHPKGQSDDDFINYQLNNLHDEISELHEAWRSGKFSGFCDKSDKMLALNLPPLTCAEEEYADIIIRVLDQCRHLHINISRAIAIKHLFNLTREFKHGRQS